MKKFILGIAVIAAAFVCVPVFAQQANPDEIVGTEVTNDEYVQVEFQNLPEETQELLVKEFAGYEFKAIYQQIETKLLKVVVLKDEEELTFIQDEEGKFIEQK
jgi:hypothetical protein